MNPPCPPYECAHFWGPSLVSSLKDSTLHSSLRQPAFDLIETIIVSDAAALIMSIMACNTSQNMSSNVIDFDDERMDGVHSLDVDVKEEVGSWKQFVEQGKIAAQECRGWMCIPMLWIDVFVDINPTILPTSFSKAVFWARSRFPMIESEESAEMSVSIRDWLSSSVSEITASFGWKVPTGSDDGGRGKESKNSVSLSVMHTQLSRTFKRLTTHFIVQTDRELWKQWTWVPMMAESLILFLMDTDDTLRQVGKRILEKLSDTRGLASGLKFLCSSKSSLSALLLGLRHALKLVQLDSSLLNFRALHGFFFVLCKILKEGFPSPRSDTCSDSNISKFSSEGGFLKQPAADLLGVTDSKSHTIIDFRSWEKFSFLLAKCAWPFLRRCLVEGKLFFNYKHCQMTCVRLLEIFPVVFERIFTSFHHLSENSTMVEDIFDFKWFGDLVEWGNSSLEVVVRYWRQTVTSLLDVLKSTEDDKYTADIMALKSLVSCDSIAMDELEKQVSRLSVSLSKEASCKVGKKMIKSKALISGSLLFEREHSSSHVKTTSMEDAVHVINAETVADQKDDTNVIVLSDDEVKNDITASEMHLIRSGSKHGRVDVCAMPFAADVEVPQNDIENKSASEFDSSKTILKQKGYSTDCSGIDSQQDYSTANGEQVPASLGDSKALGSKGKVSASDSQSHVRNSLKKSVVGSVSSSSIDTVPRKSERVLTELRHDKENDPWDLALKSERRHLFCITKPISSIPKRKIIQLNLPMQGKSGLHRSEVGLKRFTPPNLDDWYRPILEIDYFAAVGLSASEDENQSYSKFQEIPIVFQSPEEYVGIFRPLVLEEFKSQLHSSYVEMSSLEEMHYGSVSVVSVERVDDFHLVRCVHDDSNSATSKNCSENDLVLLTRQPLKTSSHDVHLVGKVERHEKDNKRRSNILFIRFYLQNGSVRLNCARKFLAERTKWYLSRIMSITPQIREFQALSSLKQIPMLPIILKPDNVSVKFQKFQEFNLSKLSQPLQQILKSSYNECQIQAISVAIGPVVSNKDNALSLIQGPPGTGKTRTIVAIVSALLASSTRCMNETRKHYSGSRKLSCTNTKPSVCESVAIARAWQDAALARQLDKDMAKNLNPTGSSARGRILICAQSNAAVDELVSRIFNDGLYGIDGQMYKPYLVRVGNAKTVHPNSLPFFIDTLVDHRLTKEKMDSSDRDKDICGDTSSALRSNLEKLADHIRFYEAKRANFIDKNSEQKSAWEEHAPKGGDDKELSDENMEIKLRKLYRQKNEIYKDLAAVQLRERSASEESRALKHKIRKSILKEAEIVVTTLSGCGGDLYGVCSESFSGHKFGNISEASLFDAVVIDEAAQALEPATLIPLQLLKSNGTKCIMVGDPKQLPATVLSTVASKYLYQCSMFERLQRANYPVTMLTEQYRMHPEICCFPSMHFYDSKLLNGDQMSGKSAVFHETEGLGPYVFFDIVDGLEVRGKNFGAYSLYNQHEVDATIEILRFFRKRYPSEFDGGKIGIITPYKCQLSLLRSRVSSALGPSVASDLEFNTVDGFQGREVDILVLSTVRAADPSSEATGINASGIGFVADVRRMNVALTRAKRSLWILGNTKTLKKNHNWAALVRNAKQRNLVISCKMPYQSIFNSALGNSGSKNYDSKPRQLVKDSNQFSKQNKFNSRETGGREIKNHTREIKINKRSVRGEDDLSTSRKAAQSNTRKDELGFSQKADIPPWDVRLPMNVKYGNAAKRHSRSENNCTEKSVGDLNTNKLEKVDGHKKIVSDVLREPKATSENNKKHGKTEDPTPSTGGGADKNSRNGCGASNKGETSNDLIAKRKKQRDAVDSLLSSALISTRKTGGSIKSERAKSKRCPSPTALPAGNMKSPKARKVAPGSSTHRGQNDESCWKSLKPTKFG